MPNNGIWTQKRSSSGILNVNKSTYLPFFLLVGRVGEDTLCLVPWWCWPPEMRVILSELPSPSFP